MVGGLVGAVVGLGVGARSGAVLAVLASTPILRPTAPNLPRKATLVAVTITGVAGLASQYPLLRSFPDLPVPLLPILLTVPTGMLIAAAASRRLPPGPHRRD